MSKAKKICLLYASFGGGHFAPAQALAQQLEAQYGALVGVELIDICRFVSPFVARTARRWYGWSVSRARWSYTLSYWLGNNAVAKWSSQWWMYALSRRRLEAFFKTKEFDAVVLFHFFGWGIQRTVRRFLPQAFFCFVVTDPFTPHGLWFMNTDAHYITFSELVAQQARRVQRAAGRVVVTAPFIREEFIRMSSGPSTSAAELRARYKLPPNKPVVLILSGGAGIRAFESLTPALLALPSSPTVLVAGTPDYLLNKMRTLAQQSHGRVQVFGFVPFVHELLAVCDVVLGKAGASSTMEALYLKKPHILIDYIWGQESGTKDWLQRERLGWYEPRFAKVPTLVENILNKQKNALPVLESIQQYELKNGTVEAAAWLLAKIS